MQCADGGVFVAPVALFGARLARMAESADATDSNSVARKGVRVQVPLRAPAIDPPKNDADSVVAKRFDSWPLHFIQFD